MANDQPDHEPQHIELRSGVHAKKIVQRGSGNTVVGGDQVNQGPGSTYISHVDNLEITLAESAPPAQLPPDIPDFTGRNKEVASLKGVISRTGRKSPIAVAVSAVAGKPGVGKSALAIHVAHQLAARFPDGQLYTNLRGSDNQPLTPNVVLEEFLRRFGVTGEALPETLDARAAIYRERLAGKRILVLLDNAANERQVRPLLPGTPGCAVIVTSRAPLATLGDFLLELDVLNSAHAIRLLAKIVGQKRTAREPEQAAEVARLCGYLPLALRIVGGKLRVRRNWTFVNMAHRLRDERRRLAELGEGDLDVRASFTLSYTDLSSDDARVFRLLGLFPGPDFGSLAVAAMNEVEPAEAETALDRLAHLQLVERGSSMQRYRLHDLMRLFAQERLQADDQPSYVTAANERLLMWYLSAAISVRELMDSPGDAGVSPEEAGTAGLAWFDTERANLIAAVKDAANAELWDLSGRLASILARFLGARGSIRELEETQLIAVTAAEHTEDMGGRATALNNLGTAYARQGRWNDAASCFERCLEIVQALDNIQGQAHILTHLGLVYSELERWDEATERLQEALDIVESLDDPHAMAHTLFHVGLVFGDRGLWEESARFLEKSVRLERESADRHGEAEALTRLAVAYSNQGRMEDAIACLRQSLDTLAEFGDRHGESHTLLHISSFYADQEQWSEAISSLQRALEIERELQDRHGEAEILYHLGMMSAGQGDWEGAIAWLSKSLELTRELGYRRDEARVLLGLSDVFASQSKWHDAVHWLKQHWHVQQLIGDRKGEARALARLASAYLNKGQRDEAIAHGERSLAILRDLGADEVERVQAWLDRVRAPEDES